MMADLPLRHFHRCFEDGDLLRNNEAAAKVIYKAEPILNIGGIVALVGERGTGKTQLAVCLACNVLSRERSVRYTTAIEMFSTITATYGTKYSEIDTVRSFARPRLLIIDEANERRDTKNEDTLLTWVLDLRYRNMKGTLLCANLNPKAFAEGMGPSITSRIWENGSVIEVKGHNWRKEKQP